MPYCISERVTLIFLRSISTFGTLFLYDIITLSLSKIVPKTLGTYLANQNYYNFCRVRVNWLNVVIISVDQLICTV